VPSPIQAIRASPRRRSRPGSAGAADYVRVTIALTVLAADVADALAVAWAAFRSAAGSDLTGWEAPAAAADVRPEPAINTSQQSH
jgi:hypothetical protein